MTTSTVGCVRPRSTSDPNELARWFARAAHGGGLVQYLEGFRHTVAVMQDAESLHRVARECVYDFADDGVVYAEVRFAPELHTDGGLALDDVVEAVAEGFAAASAERGITVYLLLSAMRQGDHSMQTAETAVRWRDRGVVGFDIAGPEKGFPPTQHLSAFQLVQRANFHSTIHAGEAFGLPSIWEALQWCGA
jgi:adenosine deaminase